MTVIKPKEHKIKYLFLSDVEFHGRYFLMLADLIFDDANSAFSEFSLSELHRKMNVPDWFVTKAIDGLKEKKLIELYCQESNRVKGRKKLYVRLLKDDKWAYEDSCPALLFPHQLAMIKSLLPENGISSKNKRHPDLTFHDRTVLIVMITLMSGTWSVNGWSHTDIGKLVDRSRGQIRNHIHKFISLGIIRKVMDGFRHFGFNPIPTVYSFSPCSKLWKNVFNIQAVEVIDGRFLKEPQANISSSNIKSNFILNSPQNVLSFWGLPYEVNYDVVAAQFVSFIKKVADDESRFIEMKQFAKDARVIVNLKFDEVFHAVTTLLRRFSGTKIEQYISINILEEIANFLRTPQSNDLQFYVHRAINRLPVSIARLGTLGALDSIFNDILNQSKATEFSAKKELEKDFFNFINDMVKKMLVFTYQTEYLENKAYVFYVLSQKYQITRHDVGVFLVPYTSDHGEKGVKLNWLRVNFQKASQEPLNSTPNIIQSSVDGIFMSDQYPLDDSYLIDEKIGEILMHET